MAREVLCSKLQSSSSGFGLKSKQVTDHVALFFFTCSEKYVSWLHHRVNITGCIYAELGGRAHCIHGTHNCILWFSCDGSVLACLHQHHHKCD